MSFSTCPTATVNAPIEQVWRLLADPARYDLWWDAQTRSIIPEGPAQPGQQIFAYAVALRRQWNVHITVLAVTPEKHQLDYLSRLPLGITGHNHLTCTRLDDQHTRVSFG
jgi:hypothetical protein